MKIKEVITEALKPSQYRPYVKNWNKDLLKDYFLNSGFKHDRNGYRIYIPFESGNIKVKVPVRISKELADKEYKVHDYIKGLAVDKTGRRIVRIGKLLSSDAAKNKFANDPNRQAQGNYSIVISRHPYDVAGMSTDRGWNSCMNLDCDSKQFKEDIQGGMLVAYLIRSDDLDIKNPVARVAIRPYVDIFNGQTLYGASTEIYGTAPAAFKHAVVELTNSLNNAIKLPDTTIAKRKEGGYREFRDPPTLYFNVDMNDILKLATDAFRILRTHNVRNLSDLKNSLEKTPYRSRVRSKEFLSRIENLNFNEQLIFVNMYPYGIKLIDDPSDAAVKLAVSKDPKLISAKKNPSEELQLSAVKISPNAIKYIDNPTPKAIEYAIQQKPNLGKLFKKKI
jgi:hypothetical protein